MLKPIHTPPSPDARTEAGVAPVCTFVLWLACLAVGLLGFTLSYGRPQAEHKSIVPIQAELLEVDLAAAEEFLPMPETVNPLAPEFELLEPPSLAPRANIPPPPDLVALAEPSAALAFPVPVDAPARIVPAAEASYRTAATATERAERSGPVAQALTFGEGQGRQPAPIYPRTAIRQGQEGTVLVRLTVGPDGRVLAAKAISPSPWPLLNDSAVWTCTPSLAISAW